MLSDKADAKKYLLGDTVVHTKRTLRKPTTPRTSEAKSTVRC